MLKKIHHVGIVVRNLEQAYAFYRDTLGLPVHKVAVVEDQGVKAALLTIGGSEIELLEPINESGGVAKFLEKRGEGIHHICFDSGAVAFDLKRVSEEGFPVIDETPRESLGELIAFLHPKGLNGVLVEFKEKKES